MGLVAVIVAQVVAAAPTAAERAAAQLPLRQLAGHAILLRFDGNPAPGYVVRALRAGEVAGVILFRDNATDAASTRALTEDLQRAAGGRAIVATDQEGGAIRILGWAPPALAPPQLASAGAARRAARATARGLREAGVNLDLAPVADGPEAIMATRAYPGSPGRRGRAVAAAVRGLRAGGVGATLKHFPGLGAATGNTDKVRVTVRGVPELQPFRAGIAAGAGAVMVSHAVYAALDPDHVASQSRTIVTGLLKRRLGFTRVAMTDSLEAFSVRSRMTMEQAAVRSVRAGIDLLLTTGAGTYLRARDALVAAARRDPAFRTRLRDAAARVLTLQDALRSR